MTFDEYREFYIKSILNTSLSENLHPIDAFINDVSDMMIEDYSMVNEINLCNYEWKSANKMYKSMKLDAYSVDRVSNAINLLIADFNDGEIKLINNEVKNTLSQLMINFFENCLKGFFNATEQSAIHTQASIEIRQNISYINKVQLFIISTNKISERVKDLTLEAFTFHGQTFAVKLNIIDFNMIYKTRALSFEKEDVIINTEDYGVDGIPCIKAQLSTDDYDSYLAVMPGEFLADIYDRYSSQLLESNVRSFLSFRGAINKGIRGTILNSKDKFFTYNNGISATATEIKCDYREGQGTLITSFTNLQIINGGQTTASLASTRIKDKASLSGIYVQMKLTIVKENDPDFVRNIAKYANSQNKVTSADLNSNHPFYARIEDYSRKTYAPAINGNPYQELWFFERARGQYEQPMIKMTTKKQRDDYQKVRPKSKRFTKTDLAKYINSANMQPYYVSWGSEVNATRFQEQLEKQWEKDNAHYNEYFYKELIGMAIMYKSLEKIISEQEWYIENRAYRPQLVTYTFSKFVYEAKKEGLLVDYKYFWDKQEIPQEISDELAKISKLAFDVIYGEREISNISSYCKKKECWERLQAVPYKLSNNAKEYLLTNEEREIGNRGAKREQKKEEQYDYEVKIYEFGADYWQNLIDKAIQQEAANGKEISFLEAAKKSCKTGYLVSEKQASQIKKVVDKLKEVGIE